MADASVKIGGDISELQRKLKEAGGNIKGFGERARKDVGGLDLGKALGLVGGTAALGMLIKRGFAFNQSMKDSEVAIANVVMKFQGLNEEAAKNEAKLAMEAIVAMEPKSAASLQGLTEGFLATFAAAQSAGVSIKQNVDLVGKMANAIANANIPAEQLVQELRSIMQGNITNDSALARMLQINNADINRAKEAGKLYEFLVNKMGTLGEAGDTAAVAFSTLASAIDKALGAATKDLFDQSVNGAKDLSAWVDANAESFKSLGTTAAGAVSLVGDSWNLIRGMFPETTEMNEALKAMDDLYKAVRKFGEESEGSRIQADWARSLGVTEEQIGAAVNRGMQDREADKKKGEGDKARAEAEKAAAAAAESARKQTAAMKELASVAEQVAEVEKLREKLGEKEFQRMVENMTGVLAVEAAEKRITKERERQQQMSDANMGILSQEEEIANKMRLIELEEELAKARKRAGDEAEAAADKARDAAKKEQSDLEAKWQKELNVMDLEKEMALLEARAAGDDRKVKMLEREMEIERKRRAIMEATGQSADEALETAKRMQDLQEKAEARERGGKGRRSKIMGYSRERQGAEGTTPYRGLDAWEDLQKEPSAWDKLQGEESAWDKLQGEESAWDKLQGEKSTWDKLQERKPQNPAVAMAEKNAAQETGLKALAAKMDEQTKILTAGLLA